MKNEPGFSGELTPAEQFEKELWQKKAHLLDIAREGLEKNPSYSLDEKKDFLKKIGAAMLLSLEIHKDQAPREDGPYVNHILRVATRLIEEFEVTDPEVIMAALLHDSIEDQSAKLAELSGIQAGSINERALSYLEKNFSPRVREIVTKLCNPEIDKTKPEEVYLADYAAHIREAVEDPGVLPVKLSDFMDNGLRLETVSDANMRFWYSRKYLPVMQIFLERLDRAPDIFKSGKVEEIKNVLLEEIAKAEGFIKAYPNEKGRNLEEDQKNFLEAIAETRISEIETDIDEASRASFDSELEEARLFLLGEIHGVKENSQIIYTLFRKFGFRQLALEWDASLKEVAEAFLKSGELDFTAVKNSPDGRITAGHFALLKQLRDEGLLDELICFDQGGSAGWDERDACMAHNILAQPLHSKTLVVAGNLHTQVRPVFIENEEHHPLGEILKKQRPAIVSGKIRYVKGEYHNFGIRKIAAESEASPRSAARFYKSEHEGYIFELPEAQRATVPNPGETLE